MQLILALMKEVQSDWKKRKETKKRNKKKASYIVAISTEGVSEEVRDQAVGLPGTKSTWTFQRTSKMQKKITRVLFSNFTHLYILK